MTPGSATLIAVSVGRPREFDFKGHRARSAIWKTPVTGRVEVRGVNLEGDDQADREAHGDPDKAVYAYAVEDARWWEQEIGRPFSHGEFGENLTTKGIEVSNALIGERWEIGTTLLEVAQPRIPCWRLGVRMNDPLFPRRFADAGRPGAYLRILREGNLGSGDEIRSVEKPGHDLKVADVSRIYFKDRDQVARLLTVPRLSEGWKEWATEYLHRSAR